MPWRVATLAQALQPGDGRRDVAALAEHRLDDHGRDGVGRRLEREQLVEGAERGVGRRRRSPGAQRVGVRRDRDATEQRLVAVAVLALGGGERGGAQRAAVEAAAEGDDAGPAGDLPGQLDGAVDRLGAGVAEEHLRVVEERGRARRAARPARCCARGGRRPTCASADATCAVAAATTRGWQWPTLVTAMPDVEVEEAPPVDVGEPRALGPRRRRCR